MIPVFAPTVFMPKSAGPGGTVTFDPTFNSTPAYSNGNLTASTSSAHQAVRSTVNHNSGKYYCELKVIATPSGNYDYSFGVGITIYSSTPINALGNDSNLSGGTDVAGDGNYYTNGNTPTACGISALVNGDIVGIAIDFGGPSIWFRKNGGNWNGSGTANPATPSGGISLSNLSGSLYFMVNFYNAGTSVTLNFGQTSYSFTVPSGFGNW